MKSKCRQMYVKNNECHGNCSLSINFDMKLLNPHYLRFMMGNTLDWALADSAPTGGDPSFIDKLDWWLMKGGEAFDIKSWQTIS